MAVRAILLIAMQPGFVLSMANALKKQGLQARIVAGPHDIIIDDVKAPTEAHLCSIKEKIEELPGIKHVEVRLIT